MPRKEKPKKQSKSMAEQMGELREELESVSTDNIGLRLALEKLRGESTAMAASYKKRVEELNATIANRQEQIDRWRDQIKRTEDELKAAEKETKERIDKLNRDHGKQIKKYRDERYADIIRADAAERSMSVMKDQMILLEAHNKEMEDLLVEAAQNEQASMPMTVVKGAVPKEPAEQEAS